MEHFIFCAVLGHMYQMKRRFLAYFALCYLCDNNGTKRKNLAILFDTFLFGTLKLNSSAYEKHEYWHLGRWCIKLTLFKRF